MAASKIIGVYMALCGAVFTDITAVLDSVLCTSQPVLQHPRSLPAKPAASTIFLILCDVRSHLPTYFCNREGTVKRDRLCQNNSCFYLCNGRRTTVHILAGWSCHKSLILGLSTGPRCQVAFGHLQWDRSRTHRSSGLLVISQVHKVTSRLDREIDR